MMICHDFGRVIESQASQKAEYLHIAVFFSTLCVAEIKQTALILNESALFVAGGAQTTLCEHTRFVWLTFGGRTATPDERVLENIAV